MYCTSEKGCHIIYIVCKSFSANILLFFNVVFIDLRKLLEPLQYGAVPHQIKIKVSKEFI